VKGEKNGEKNKTLGELFVVTSFFGEGEGVRKKKPILNSKKKYILAGCSF
jgi:hypothetical protein